MFPWTSDSRCASSNCKCPTACPEDNPLYPDPVPKPATPAKDSTPAPQPADTPREAARSDVSPLPSLPRQGGISKQILVQPKLHIQDQLAEKIPVPSAVMWMPELNHPKVIIPAKPTLATLAVAPPSVAEPNEELDIAEVNISRADLQPKIATPPPSTTTPLAQSGKGLVKLPPTTQTQDTGQPTPTALLSVSNVRMPEGLARAAARKSDWNRRQNARHRHSPGWQRQLYRGSTGG